MFLRVLRALKRTQNTQKHVLQLSVAEGDQPVREYFPYRSTDLGKEPARSRLTAKLTMSIVSLVYSTLLHINGHG